MKADRDPLLFIYDIIESINQIQLYLEGWTYELFLKSREKQDAVIRNFEVIGEALKYVDKYFPDLRDKYPQIDWKHIVGMRDYIAHEYFGLNQAIIWDAYEHDLPQFKNQIDAILLYLKGEK